MKVLYDASVAFLLMLTQPRKHQVYLMRWVKFKTVIFCFNMNALEFNFNQMVHGTSSCLVFMQALSHVPGQKFGVPSLR